MGVVVQAFYSDHFVLPLPDGHRFPMRKYRLLREWVAQHLPQVSLQEPMAATDGELALAHTPDYVQRVVHNRLSLQELRELGFPWSEQMVERSRRSTGATIGACRAALKEGIAMNLAGGTHHAYADKGSGFCVFNDAVVAARLMQAEQARLGKSLPVAIIDLDVHQGNGTASIVRNDPSIFTFSLHGENNFPFRKECSNLDLGLPDGAGDEVYMEALQQGMAELFQRFFPELIIYLAGADVYEGDRLGKLKLSPAGIARRDQYVLQQAGARKCPVAIAMAGGYGHVIEETVRIQYQTVEIALKHYGIWA
jgi:acetoin utilization deacetylase AcuC-like enzyme